MSSMNIWCADGALTWVMATASYLSIGSGTGQFSRWRIVPVERIVGILVFPADDVDIGTRGTDVRFSIRKGALGVDLDRRDPIRIEKLRRETRILHEVLREHEIGIGQRRSDLGAHELSFNAVWLWPHPELKWLAKRLTIVRVSRIILTQG